MPSPNTTVDPLPDDAVARLRGQRPTYDASLVGRTLTQPRPPSPYHGLHRARVVGSGAEDFARARADLADWQVQRRSGLRVRADGPTTQEGVVAELRIGLGPASLRAPVVVVSVVDEERRVGYAYATLPGHPEDGEEAFVLTMADDGTVRFTITAFSRPANLLTRLGGPVGALAQRRIAERYLRSLLA